MYTKFLKKLWLSQVESDIYLLLLNNSKKNISQISAETWINRPKLYKTLPYMEEMWLISVILVGERKFYIAENPKILSNYFENIKEDFDIFLPKIENIYSNNFKKPIFKNSKWKKAIRNIFLDIWNILDTWDIFYRYSSRNNKEKSSIPRNEYLKYKKIRNEKKLERMVITNEYLNNLKTPNSAKQVVVIPKNYDIFEDNITKIIYANKVAIIDYNTDECFIIESIIFATFERKLFKLLFKLMQKAGH